MDVELRVSAAIVLVEKCDVRSLKQTNSIPYISALHLSQLTLQRQAARPLLGIYCTHKALVERTENTPYKALVWRTENAPYKALLERTENNPYKALVERTENTPQWVYIVVKIKFVPMLWRCKFNKFLCYIFKFNYCKLLSMVRRLQMDGRTFYSPLNTMDCYWGVPGPWSQFGDGLWDKGGVTLWTCISLDQNKWTSYGHLSC